jgi:hypothetical protein
VRNRWVAYSGGIGVRQLAWLQEQLQAAHSEHERVIIMCHCPLHPATVDQRASTLLWNYDEVLAAIRRVPGTVAATFAGVFAEEAALPCADVCHTLDAACPAMR